MRRLWCIDTYEAVVRVFTTGAPGGTMERVMPGKAFVVMQIGSTDSVERKRAEEVYEFIVQPALDGFDISAYRADLDPSPGGITPKLLQELISADLVIADLTGNNANVFYELGIAHAFAKPLITIADSVKKLPFDAKDERVIELGDYAPTGLTIAQGNKAKSQLVRSLEVVRAPGYVPPSPVREAAAIRSLDDLAPDNPIAAELAQIRESLEELRKTASRQTHVESIALAEGVYARPYGRRDISTTDATKRTIYTYGPLITRSPSDPGDMPDVQATWLEVYGLLTDSGITVAGALTLAPDGINLEAHGWSGDMPHKALDRIAVTAKLRVIVHLLETEPGSV